MRFADAYRSRPDGKCDFGFEWGGTAITGCTANCSFALGWRCQQPGSPGYIQEIEGPIPIPGPDNTQYVDALGVPQGWGEVPLRTTFGCWCANVAGTYANTTRDCVPEACPYPIRCVARTLAFVNGTTCARGSEGTACITCSKRFYRLRDECVPCPTGIPVSVILLAIGLGVFLLYVGPKLSQVRRMRVSCMSVSCGGITPLPAHSPPRLASWPARKRWRCCARL